MQELNKEKLNSMNAVDIAAYLASIEDDVLLTKTFKILSKDLAAEVFAELDGDTQQTLTECLSSVDIEQIVAEMYNDDAVDFLHELPVNVVDKILKATTKETRDSINKLLHYPDHSAGSLMTTEMLELKKDLTVKQAFEEIRLKGNEVETLKRFYITSPEGKLEGVIPVRELLIADPKAKLKDIMETNVICSTTQTNHEEIANIFTKYGFSALPIVDSEQKLVGIVTFDDVLRLVQQETTEDMHKLAAIKPTQKPYLKTSAWEHAKSRMGWLIILSLSAILTGAVITTFESALLVLPILMSFIPMLMDTGGNCGAQSSTVVIRGMALDEINLKDFFKVMRKEMMVATYCGIVVGGINFLRVIIQYGFNEWPLGLTVWFGLWATMIISKILGALLPALAKKIKLDPALMSAPLITTISDILGLLCFFGFAKIFLPI